MRVFNSPFQKIYSAGILFLLLLILLPHCSAWHKHRRRSTFSESNQSVIATQIALYHLLRCGAGNNENAFVPSEDECEWQRVCDLRFIDFKFEEEPQRNVSALESLVLDCQYVVRNDKYVRDVRIEWKRDGAIINEKTSPRTKVLSNGSLSLLGVTSSDEGTYQCYVHVSTVGIYGNDSQMWTFVSRKAQIRVADLPKFDVQPTDKSVVKGQPAAFQCLLATAVHSAQLHHITTWYHNGIPVNLEGGDFLILPLTNTLEISSTQPRHDGDYKCTVQGAGKRRTSQTARLTVTAETDSIAQSDITFVTSPRLQEVDEGDSFVLECLAASRHRQPEVRWLKDSRQVLVDGVRLRRVGVASLLVRLATVEDSGLYTCRVSNSIDSVDKAVSVVVRTAPRITTPPPSWKSAVETADVELECAASGRPAPRVSWLKNGETIIPSEYFVIEANRLRILGLVKSDQAVYQCVAENEIGSEQASSQLLINVPDASSMVAASTGDPIVSSPPLGLRASSIGSRFLLLNWDKPLQENGNLVRYHIFFKEADSDRERMANSSTTSLSLTALQPATMYIVRVAAENEAGIGRFSEAVKVMTNKEQAVPGRVTSLAATALGPQTIEVHWRAPAGGQPAQRYKLFYTSHASRKDGEDEDNKKETQITTTATSYTLHGMEKYMEYLIRVEADGENGSGLSSEVVKVRTLSDKPSLPPRSIAAEADSSTSLRVSWSEAEENSVNGELTGYRIRYKTNARGSKVNNLAIDANVREYTLAGLEPGTQYLLRMAVINHNGTGTFSDWITVETPTQDKEERILSAPREIRPHAGVDYIFVAWLPPADETNLVRGYQVGWGLGIPDTDSVKVAATVTQHKISGLLSGRDYVVSLRAFNSQGNGFPIYETVRTLTKRAEGDGGSPLNDDGRQAEDEARSEEVNTPLGVRAETLSATSIRVLWIADVDAFNALYTVRYSTSADGNQQRYSNTSDPWAVVEGLRPATEYELAVRTVAGSGQVSGWSLVTRNRTLAAAPSSSPRDLTVLPAESGDPHSVSLHWQPPKYANGEIEEYVIYYTDRESLADKDWIINYVGGERLSHQISNLLPYAAYFFKIQARNEKGYGPFSPVQGYTPLGGVLLSEESRENRHRVGDGSAQWWGEKLRKAVSANPMYMALAVALMIILVLCVVLAVMCCIKRSTGRTPKNAYNTGKKTATSVPGRQEAPVDLWIQPNNSTGVHMRAGASDYMVDGLATAHLTALNGEDIDTSSPPPPRYQHLQGTLSRSYHQSSSSLEGGAPRQRTPQVVYTGTGRHQPIAKIDFCESSPYGSSSALGSATPPPLPPLQAPPSGPPSSVADGYRTLRGTPQSSTSNALRSFAQHLSGAAPPPTSAGRTIVVASGGRYVPVGRAAAQPRVNVANIYSPYASCSSNVCSEDAEKKTDGDIELSETPSKPSEKEKDSSHPMHPSNSTEELNAQMENLDTMIDDLQALQHEFGVTS